MNKIKNYFSIDGEISKREEFWISLIGWGFLFGIWWIITALKLINPYVLPSPIDVFKSYEILFVEKNLLYHTGYSISVNLVGYLQAIIIAIALGFVIGLIPFFRALLIKQLEALRFTPLPATTAIFMSLFGVGFGMKSEFLAFGILVYLLPSIVQRIDEIKTDSHLKALKMTMKTLNASTWQSLKHFYFPSVLSRFLPDIINLVAVSWTYIVVVELLNAQGGLGYVIFRATNRTPHIEQVYAVIILIILIGMFQDKGGKLLDKKLCKFKYA